VAVATFIDGIDVSATVLEGKVTPRLNRPRMGSFRMPIQSAVGGVGSRIKVEINSVLFGHGFCLTTSDEAGEDTGYTEYLWQDPMELWRWRPARDADGDFSKPTFIEDFITGPQIMEQILQNSEDPGGIPTTAEGPLFIAYGSFATGGVDLSGAPTDWPMTISEIASLLTDTGELDIVLTPIDSGGDMAQIDCYNGDYGTDLSGSVAFEYGIGAHNVRGVRQVIDMNDMCNKLWYFLGPRVGTPEDPAGDQHWRANVTGTDPGLADPPQTAIEALRVASQATYGVRMDIKIFDARGDEATVGRDLYRRLWQLEQWIRSQPRRLVHITPIRGAEIGTFDIGDLVTVTAGSILRGGFTGVQRVYAYTISFDADGVQELGELVTSPTQEGM
jgi:hypothetical protein